MDRLLTMEAFVRVVDAGSFSAAARHWGRSKAVVSKYVSALEEDLGVQLLRRTTRSLSLTEAGRAYRERCTDVLGEIQSLEASVREGVAAPRGRVALFEFFGRTAVVRIVAHREDGSRDLVQQPCGHHSPADHVAFRDVAGTDEHDFLARPGSQA